MRSRLTRWSRQGAALVRGLGAGCLTLPDWAFKAVFEACGASREPPQRCSHHKAALLSGLTADCLSLALAGAPLRVQSWPLQPMHAVGRWNHHKAEVIS